MKMMHLMRSLKGVFKDNQFCWLMVNFQRQQILPTKTKVSKTINFTNKRDLLEEKGASRASS